MMTTAQLVQRLAQKMWGQDFARLSMTTAEELRDAINLGLDGFNKLLPHHRRQRSESFPVESPQPVDMSFTSGRKSITVSSGFPLGFYETSGDLAGRSVIVEGNPAQCRILSPTSLLQPWLGPNGTAQGTVYGDGIPLSAQVEQLASEVTWTAAAGGDAVPLNFLQSPLAQLGRGLSMSLGAPERCWLESIGGSEAVDVRLLLRLWPLPNVRGLVTVTLQQFAAPVTLNDLNVTPRALPVDEIEQGHLVNLCAQHLTNAANLREGLDKAGLVRAAEASVSAMEARANPNPSGQPNQFGTPRRW